MQVQQHPFAGIVGDLCTMSRKPKPPVINPKIVKPDGVSDLQMSPNVIVDLTLEGIGSVPICEGGSHTEGRAEQAKELGNTLDRIASFVLGAI